MRSFLVRVIGIFLVLLFLGCEDSGGLINPYLFLPSNENQITISQGIWGNVWFWKGDFQPTTPSGTITPVERDLYIYTPTNSDSVVREGYGGFYSSIQTTLVSIVSSNRTGFYQATLPPGKYSVFIKEDSLFWQGWGSSIGIGGFEVHPDSVSKVQLDITYMAAY